MSDTYWLGMELNYKEVRLCAYNSKDKEAVSVMMHSDTSRAQCPARIAHFTDCDSWKLYGDADVGFESSGTFVFDDILKHCLAGESYDFGGSFFEPYAVLARLIFLTLKSAGINEPSNQVKALVLTTPKITGKLALAAQKAFKDLGLGVGAARIQSFDESFYAHTYCQSAEIHSRNAGLFYFDTETHVYFKSLRPNYSTRPVTVTLSDVSDANLPRLCEERDLSFEAFIKECTEGAEFSSFFLVGNGFSRKWAVKSLQLLCRSRRKVFFGNNLFAKGACYSACRKIRPEIFKKTLFLGPDLVRINIGINLKVRGIMQYYPLITAGINWYEAEKEIELILGEEKSLIFSTSRLESGRRADYSMELANLPARPPMTTRLNVRLCFESPKKCLVTVKDMGFGEIFPSSGLIWKDSLT